MLVKVFNDNVHPFKQKFKDVNVEIPAKGFVMLDADFAHEFKCAYSPIKMDADGNPTPESYKMIRVDRPDIVAKPVEIPLNCHKCGYASVSAKDLSEHTVANHDADEKVTIAEMDALMAKTQSKKAK